MMASLKYSIEEVALLEQIFVLLLSLVSCFIFKPVETSLPLLHLPTCFIWSIKVGAKAFLEDVFCIT